MKKRILATILGVMLLFVGGIDSAQAATKKVGGGTWTYAYLSGVMVTTKYQHTKKKHSTTAIVGNKGVTDTKQAGQSAHATKTGVGVAQCWWNTY